MSFADRLAPGRVAIFLFHGVIERQQHRVRNYTGKHLERARFREVLVDLLSRGRPLSMDEVLRRCEAGEDFPDHSFAITFDDGFENNLSVAAPVLEELAVPATFYVTTGFVQSNGMSWIDRIEAVVEAALSRAQTLRLRLPWDDRPWPAGDVGEARALLTEIRRVVKSQPGFDTEALIHGLAEQCALAAPQASDDPLDRKLDWAGVRQLAEHPLFLVGGHSHTHPILTFLDPPELQHEVAHSLALLREHAGVSPVHYSYPEGMLHCYSGAVIAVLKQHGVRCCPTAIDGLNPRGSDPFQLLRVPVV
jgi:peptidoglycan/xylan/chitin deacetylase (PgdA/CDA1 family)